MKNAFLRPLTMRSNVFWVSKNQNSMEKIGQNFHICLRSGPPLLTVSLTVKYPFFDAFPKTHKQLHNIAAGEQRLKYVSKGKDNQT